MKCDKCGRAVAEGEEHNVGGRLLCEDCLMDSMSPSKACDPWAVKLAKGAGVSGTGEKHLKGLEKSIFDFVREKGAVPKEDLPGLLGVTMPEVERAFSVLRHMELLRGRRRPDGGADIIPFN